MKMKTQRLRTKHLIASVFLVATLAIGASASTPSELSQFLAKTHTKTGIIKPPKGLLKHEYLVPAGPYYQLFDWDMYFMAVALSYDKVSDPVVGSVEDFLEYVDENSNDPGYAPREIAPDQFWALPEACKPFLAQAAVRASETRGDYGWAGKLFQKKQSFFQKLKHWARKSKQDDTQDEDKTPYGKLKLMVQYWERDRKAADGLFVWYNGEESGADNNPAVSDSPSRISEGVDLQVYMYREYLALAKLADNLDHSDEADSFRKTAEDLRQLMIARMWSEADGTFYNINSRTGEQVRIKTWTNFTPLWAKMASPAQAKRMIDEHLLSASEFWAPHGVRSIAKSEPLYNPSDGYWQGPVWTLTNYLMMHGLMNYGYQDRAVELAQKTVDLLVGDFKDSGGMNECYNPETGEPTASDHFVSWSLLAEHMLEEAQTGADPTGI